MCGMCCPPVWRESCIEYHVSVVDNLNHRHMHGEASACKKTIGKLFREARETFPCGWLIEVIATKTLVKVIPFHPTSDLRCTHTKHVEKAKRKAASKRRRAVSTVPPTQDTLIPFEGPPEPPTGQETRVVELSFGAGVGFGEDRLREVAKAMGFNIVKKPKSGWTPEKRKLQSKRMKEMWAARRAACF